MRKWMASFIALWAALRAEVAELKKMIRDLELCFYFDCALRRLAGKEHKDLVIGAGGWPPGPAPPATSRRAIDRYASSPQLPKTAQPAAGSDGNVPGPHAGNGAAGGEPPRKRKPSR